MASQFGLTVKTKQGQNLDVRVEKRLLPNQVCKIETQEYL